MKTSMLDKPTMHEQWIEIVKYVVIYVTPLVVAIWKITDKWGEVQKQRLAESLKEAVRDVVNPQLQEINHKIDEIKKQAERDRDATNGKFFELMKSNK